MGRGGRDLATKRVPWWDREAHWRSLGFSSFDASTKRRVVYWSWVGYLGVTAALFAASRAFAEPAAATPFSAARCAAVGVLALAACYALATDAYRNPPSLQGSAAHACARYLGPYAYFTKHALTIQAAHLTTSLVAEVGGDRRLLASTHAFASFAAVVGVALTVLFLRLNWFDASWRAEVLVRENDRMRGAFTGITLTAHLVALPVALADAYLAKRPYVYPLNAASIARVTAFACVYPPLYCGATLANYAAVGHYPYPFMRSLATTAHWVAFCGALIVLLNGVILPLTFFLLRANPTA